MRLFEFWDFLAWGVAASKFLCPFISEKKKIVRIIGFMVFKLTDLDSRSQRKNRFWKICTESWDIVKNVFKSAKIGLPNQTSKIWHILAVFSGLGAYFSKLFFALKPWVQAGRFEYNEPYNPKNFFSHLYRGQSHFQCAFSKGRWSRKTLKFWEVYFFIHWNDISLGQNQRSKFLQIGTP